MCSICADVVTVFILNVSGMRVWTSWMKRTIETAADIQAPQVRYLI
jgi:hypothetical protein